MKNKALVSLLSAPAEVPSRSRRPALNGTVLNGHQPQHQHHQRRQQRRQQQHQQAAVCGCWHQTMKTKTNKRKIVSNRNFISSSVAAVGSWQLAVGRTQQLPTATSRCFVLAMHNSSSAWNSLCTVRKGRQGWGQMTQSSASGCRIGFWSQQCLAAWLPSSHVLAYSEWFSWACL